MRAKNKYLQNSEIDEFDEFNRKLSVARNHIDELQIRLHKRQVYTYYIEPVFQNGWAQPDPPVEPFAWRLWTGSLPEFKGHLDASGASSGTVAFTLPTGADGVVLSGDVYRGTIITPDNGTTFQTAMIKIESTTNDVTIVFPAS